MIFRPAEIRLGLEGKPGVAKLALGPVWLTLLTFDQDPGKNTPRQVDSFVFVRCLLEIGLKFHLDPGSRVAVLAPGTVCCWPLVQFAVGPNSAIPVNKVDPFAKN